MKLIIITITLFFSILLRISYCQVILSMSDNFENGLGQWNFYSKTTMEPISDEVFWVDSGDEEHDMVLSLIPGELIALIKGSDGWKNYKIEGDVCFPRTDASLMGLVYNFNLIPRPNWRGDDNRLRTEFGSVYIKCGGSYIRVNPHFDGTAGRALYEDYKQPLTGEATISVGKWKHFKYEIFGGTCHLYVDDMEKPKVTFHEYHHTSGRVGFRPRSGGSECWIDNVQLSTISELSFKGRIPSESGTAEAGELVSEWEVIGPYQNRVSRIEEAKDFTNRSVTIDDQNYTWDTFLTDQRGCVISGKICDFNLPNRRFAYFRTRLLSDKNTESILRFSSRSNLIVFMNGKAVGNIEKVEHIWPDFWKRTRHDPTDIEVQLKKGINYVTILVDGGQYPGCGFYLHVEDVKKQ